jgi:L-lactate dehydrogenase (cytochrome)
MRAVVQASLISAALAASPFLNEPDTGFQDYLYTTNWTERTQPLLKDIRGIPDFDYAASQKLDLEEYSFYRTGSAGEWSTSTCYWNSCYETLHPDQFS